MSIPIPLPLPQSVPNTICIRPRPLRPHLPPIDSGTALLHNPNLNPPSELIHGLLHKSTKGVIASGSKAGKTWLLLDLAVSVSTGTRFLKWPTTQGRVLFINLEIHRAFLKQRLEVVVKAKGLDNIDNLDFWTLRGQSADVESLLESVVERAEEENYSLIILDPIYKLMIGRSENSSSGVGLLCHHLEQIMVKTGAAVVFAHHFTKGNQAGKKAMDRMSGSGVFARDADTILTLTEHEEEGYNVEMSLRNLPPQPPFVVEWQFPLIVERPDLVPDLEGEPGALSENEEYLLGLLQDHPLTTAEWEAAAQNVSRATFFRVRANLETSFKVSFNPSDKTWTKVETQSDVQIVSSGETCETCETGETGETLRPETSESEPASLPSAGAGLPPLQTPESQARA